MELLANPTSRLLPEWAPKRHRSEDVLCHSAKSVDLVLMTDKPGIAIPPTCQRGLNTLHLSLMHALIRDGLVATPPVSHVGGHGFEPGLQDSVIVVHIPMVANLGGVAESDMEGQCMGYRELGAVGSA